MTPEEAELMKRLKLLATNVRKVYGRNVLMSCGLDDMEKQGIIVCGQPDKKFEPGMKLPPA